MKKMQQIKKIEAAAVALWPTRRTGCVPDGFIELEKAFERAGGTRGGYVSLHTICVEHEQMQAAAFPRIPQLFVVAKKVF